MIPRQQFHFLQLAVLLLLCSTTLLAAPTEEVVLCSPEHDPAFALRKSVAILNMTIEQPQQASDMPGLAKAVSRHLQQALGGDGLLRVRDASSHAFNPQPINLLGLVEGSLAPQLAALGKEFDSQLIIHGTINDLSYIRPQGMVRKVLTSLFPSYQERRLFAMTLTVYDSYSGSELLRHEYRSEAQGKVDMSGLQPLDRNFIASDYGQAVSGLLDTAASELQRAVSCIPLMARISGITEHGLQIADGSEAALRPGDKLKLFHRRATGVDKQGQEQYLEEYVGEGRITRAYPQSAFVELLSPQELRRLVPGDIARAW